MSSPATTSESAWARVLQDPQLRDLPYKVETNAVGQIVLRPHTPYHSLLQSEIYDALNTHVDHPGCPTTEFAVATDDGVNVPDFVWLSRDRFRQVPQDADAVGYRAANDFSRLFRDTFGCSATEYAGRDEAPPERSDRAA